MESYRSGRSRGRRFTCSKFSVDSFYLDLNLNTIDLTEAFLGSTKVLPRNGVRDEPGSSEMGRSSAGSQGS